MPFNAGQRIEEAKARGREARAQAQSAPKKRHPVGPGHPHRTELHFGRGTSAPASGYILHHPGAKDGKPCSTLLNWHDGVHTVESWNPLTVREVVTCEKCGAVGRIVEGEWEDG